MAGVVAVLALAGCGGDDGDESPPGEASVYAEIEAMTDCAALQETFDRNMDDVERRQDADPNDPIVDVVLSYAEAAQERMDDLGC